MNRRHFMRRLGAFVPAVALAPLLPSLLRNEKVPAVWMPKTLEQLSDWAKLRRLFDSREALYTKGHYLRGIFPDGRIPKYSLPDGVRLRDDGRYFSVVFPDGREMTLGQYAVASELGRV